MQDGFSFFFSIFKQKIRYAFVKIAKRFERGKLYQQKVNGHCRDIL